MNNGIVVPDNTIAVFTESPDYNKQVSEIVHSLRGVAHRDSMSKHAYHCLPVVIGNQYGFVIKSMVTFRALWNGGDAPSDTRIAFKDDECDHNAQIVSSHFGTGIITFQNRFHFRTPPGVNLLVMDPPNYFNFNISNLFAVVEADNLRRDFTFNLKITQPNMPVQINRGDIISAILPIPRFFVDNFDMVLADNIFSQEQIQEERDQGKKFSALREGADKEKPQHVGKLYWKGVDADGNTFPNKHQKTIKKSKKTLTSEKE